MDVLNRINKVRKEKKITQKEICQRIGISESAFDNWKKGKNESYKKYLPEIANILGVNVNYLLYGNTKETDAEKYYRAIQKAPERDRKIIDLLLGF